MRIDDLELYVLHHSYPANDGFAFAGGTATGRVTTLVRVVSDSGLQGWGSAYTHPGVARATVVDHLREHLLGADIDDPRAVWAHMHRLTRWYGRAGGAVSSLGAVDTAIWDLKAQQAGVPLWKLLGGTLSRVPAYASGLLWADDLEHLRLEAKRHLQDGFTRVKMRLGRDLDYDLAAVSAVREVVQGPGDIIVDGSLSYDVDQAARVAELLDDVQALWFEEPFDPAALDRFQELRRRCATPLAAGENETGIEGFARLVEADAVDVLQPDASRVGGVTAVDEVARMATAAGKRIGTHTWSDALAVVANAHVVAAHGGITVEIDRTGNPFIDELLGGLLRVRDGLLDLGESPGLGVQPDPTVLSALSVDAWPIPGNYSDMAFGAQFASSEHGYGF
ncbi:MAG: mandelate racemase/muconate lactonizing enzyme family protein [Nostocoides sp.]